MYTALVLAAALAAQPAPNQPLGEPKLDPFIAEAIKPDDKDSPLRKLQKERARERATAIELTKKVIALGNWEANYYAEFVKTQVTLAENLAELMDKPADKIKCYEMRVAAMKEIESLIEGLVKVGKGRPQDLNLAKAARLDAEIDLLKLKGPDAKPAAADDAEALLKQTIAEVKAVAAALEKKEPEEKLKAASKKLKATMDSLTALKLPKDEEDRLKKKYEKELSDAFLQLLTAASKNPEGAKVLEGLGK